MNIVFWFLIALAGFGMWILLIWAYRDIGKIIKMIYRTFVEEISLEDEESEDY